jgi:hypothetical protein
MTEFQLGEKSWPLDGGRKVLIDPARLKTNLPDFAYYELSTKMGDILPGCTF